MKLVVPAYIMMTVCFNAKKIIGLGQILVIMLVNTGMYPILYLIKKEGVAKSVMPWEVDQYGD